jgi:hypothetical protein
MWGEERTGVCGRAGAAVAPEASGHYWPCHLGGFTPTTLALCHETKAVTSSGTSRQGV